VNQDPDQAALDQFNPAAGQISEHYQVDSYGDLILLAQQLGYDNVADTLKQSLGEEQDALDELSELGPEFDYSLF
jgi:ferritin-like metal-binding protein YciE